mmetsp:Transcript_47209/g.112164  ORF Transcript_47209/g.112164 Transcript_47209/m.112164 type:complete len:284 (+) Transcript_47209:1144-1995(+)
MDVVSWGRHDLLHCWHCHHPHLPPSQAIGLVPATVVDWHLAGSHCLSDHEVSPVCVHLRSALCRVFLLCLQQAVHPCPGLLRGSGCSLGTADHGGARHHTRVANFRAETSTCHHRGGLARRGRPLPHRFHPVHRFWNLSQQLEQLRERPSPRLRALLLGAVMGGDHLAVLLRPSSPCQQLPLPSFLDALCSPYLRRLPDAPASHQAGSGHGCAILHLFRHGYVLPFHGQLFDCLFMRGGPLVLHRAAAYDPDDRRTAQAPRDRRPEGLCILAAGGERGHAIEP